MFHPLLIMLIFLANVFLNFVAYSNITNDFGKFSSDLRRLRLIVTTPYPVLRPRYSHSY